MANRTLVVGLGTTGREICEGVFERIEGQDGGMANVPWVKIVAFDTKETEDTELGRRGMAHHIGLESARYREYITNPTKFDPVNDFSNWSDPSIISTADGGGSDHGAGNTRMIGRASFMHPDVIAKVHTAIDRALADLHGLDATIRLPEKEPVELAPTVVVFVCGTLVGGTGSGTLVDLGYLLRNHPGHSAKIKVIGVLGIPDVGLSIPYQKGNAYAAVTELGHFYYPGAKFHAKFALPTVFPQDLDPGLGAKPFDGIFLVQPRSGQTRNEVEVMDAGLSEFIYLAATSDTLPQVSAEMINPGTVYANTPDRLGRPQNFGSIGISVVEYPVEHIVRGCTARLSASTLRGWLDRTGLDADWAESEFLNRLLLSHNSVVDAMLAPSADRPAFDGQSNTVIRNAVHDAYRSGDSALSRAESEIEAGFKIGNAAGQSIGSGEFQQRVKDQADAVRRDRLKRFDDLLRDYLTNSERGLNWAEGLLTHIEMRAQQELNMLASSVDPAALEEYSGTMSQMRSQVADIQHSFLGLLGWKRMAMDQVLAKYQSTVGTYYDLRLRQLTFRSVEDLYTTIIARCKLLRSRIADPDRGMRQWAEKMYQDLRADYEVKRDKSPVVNGLALYVAGADQTLDNDFVARMKAVTHDGSPDIAPSLQGEEFAKARQLRDWTWIQDQLTGEYSTFDAATVVVDGNKDRKPRPEEAEALRKLVRVRFQELYQKSAAAILTSQNNWQALLSNVLNDAEPFIKVDDSHSSDGTPASLSDLRTPTFAFYVGAQNRDGETPEARIHQALESKIQNFIPIHQPHKIVLVRARSTFAAGSVIGMDQLRAFWEQTGGQRVRQSRRDVRWRNLNGQPLIPNLMLNIGRVFAGLAWDVIHASGHGQILVEIPATGPGGVAKTIALSRDVEEAACQLEDYGVGGWLQTKLVEKATALGNEIAAEQLNRFAQTVRVLDLTHFGKRLDDGTRVYGLMSEFLRTVPGLDEQWRAMSRPAGTVHNYRKLEVDDVANGKKAGFYCPGCDCYLGKLDEIGHIDELDECPNPLCRYPLR